MTKIANLYPLIFESINDGVFTVDEHFQITSFNNAAERITGIQREDAIGKKCHDVFRANICQKQCALRATLETGTPKHDIRVDVLNANMDAVPIEISTAVLRDENGKMMGGVEIFRDISAVECLRNELSKKHIFEDMVGRSKAMSEIFSILPQIAIADIPVLVRGPSGTGKELVANAIHNLSKRSSNAFIRVNCGALPDTLLESELFGYEKGAFTGAVTGKPGRFAMAHKGTLFLDEIGDISPAFQIKLLRALEEGEIQPLGSTKTIHVDVRLICATNRNLEQLVAENKFREDLYYRIRVVPIDIPPISERREDIPLLVAHFAKRICAKMDRNVPEFSPTVMRYLYDYGFPGNVRELRNILERAFVLCQGDTIEPGCLPNELRGTFAEGFDDKNTFSVESQNITPSNATRTKNQLNHRGTSLKAVLDNVGWNREKAANHLNVSRTTLWRWMKQSGLA